MRPENASEFVRNLQAWGRANRRSFPWRETRDPFRILVAEVLLQRSRGSTVAKVYEVLFRRWPDEDALAAARVASIRAVIRPLGLVSRAQSLKALATEVARLGRVPETLTDLMKLPGVGPYAANATLAVAFAKPSATVDGVTGRVYRRYFGRSDTIPASSDRALWRLVESVTPSRRIREWNWAVLDLAATVCLPSRPRCAECPVEAHCRWSAGRGDGSVRPSG